MKKHHFILPSIFTVLPLASVVSCSDSSDENIPNDQDQVIDENSQNETPLNPENNNDSQENPKPNPEDDYIMPKIKCEWLQGYRDQKSTFVNNKDFYLNVDELIYSDDEMSIWYVGENKGKYCFNLFDSTIKKYYLVGTESKYDYLFNTFSRPKVKDFISTEIIKDYKANMIVHHSISDENFFVPIDKSDGSVKFLNNDNIKFESSWGVGNSSSRSIIYELNINKTKIREMLFGKIEQNANNCFLEKAEVTDLYILPRSIISNHPVNYLDYWINSVRDDSNNKYLSLSKDETTLIGLDLAGKWGNGSKYWTGNVGATTKSGDIVSHEYVDGIAKDLVTMLDPYNYDYRNVINRVNKSNQERVKKYIDQVKQKGKRIRLNKLVANIESKDSTFGYTINSTIKSGANAGDWFGDWTEVGLYNIESLVKMKVEFKEYKKL